MQIQVEKNKVCIEDIEVGLQPVHQNRNGIDLELNPINASTLTYDGTKHIKQAIDETIANVTSNTNAIAINTLDLAAKASAIAANTNNIAINTNNITSNTNNITSNTNNITSNTNNITSNTNAIAINTNNITSNTNAIAINTLDLAAKANAIAANTNAIAANTNAIAANTNDITDFQYAKNIVEKEGIQLWSPAVGNRLINYAMVRGSNGSYYQLKPGGDASINPISDDGTNYLNLSIITNSNIVDNSISANKLQLDYTITTATTPVSYGGNATWRLERNSLYSIMTFEYIFPVGVTVPSNVRAVFNKPTVILNAQSYNGNRCSRDFSFYYGGAWGNSNLSDVKQAGRFTVSWEAGFTPVAGSQHQIDYTETIFY